MAETRKNYTDYINGKAPLKNAMLLMDDNDKIHDFVNASIRRDLWAIPLVKLQGWQKKLKNKNANG